MLNRFCISVVFLLAAFLLTHCAKIGTITGGPMDYLAPKIVKSNPENGAVNFKGKRIEIVFDEYIQLKDLNENFIISPPLAKQPIPRVKNQSVIVDITSPLADSTTYTFNFGNAIIDNNESNVLSNFKFVLATGPRLDSLSVKGRVVKAFDQKPDDKNVMAMLYANLNDSAPLLEKPLYVSRTNKSGYYTINNVKEGVYRLISVADANSNLKYDAGEMIAFTDSLLQLVPGKMTTVVDSIMTVQMVVDTTKKSRQTVLKPDTVITFKPNQGITSNLQLYTQTPDKVYLSDKLRKDRRRLDFVFNRPPYSPPVVQLLNINHNHDWYLQESTLNKDSITYWITDSTIYLRDTLKLSISFTTVDSLNQFVTQIDTLDMRFIASEKPQGRKRKNEKQDTREWMEVKLPTALGPNTQPYFETAFPTELIVPDSIGFFVKVDTIYQPVPFSLKRDSVFHRRFWFQTQVDADKTYQIECLPGSFTNIYGITNDTLSIDYQTKPTNYYGNLFLNITGVKTQIIVQLTDKEQVLYEKKTDANGKLSFKQIEPKTYTVKVIIDDNRNGKWDPGDYFTKKQPEQVRYFNTPINIRSDWDVEQNWNIER